MFQPQNGPRDGDAVGIDKALRGAEAEVEVPARAKSLVSDNDNDNDKFLLLLEPRVRL